MIKEKGILYMKNQKDVFDLTIVGTSTIWPYLVTFTLGYRTRLR